VLPVNAAPITPILPDTTIFPVIEDPLLRLDLFLAPSELKVTEKKSDSVTLQWQDNSTSETKFILERRISGGDYSQLAVLNADTTTYKDTTVAAGTTYYYRIRAAKGTILIPAYTSYSNELQVDTPASIKVIDGSFLDRTILFPGDWILIGEENTGDTAVEEVAAPENLEGEVYGEEEISLTWEDMSDNEEGFLLYRTSGGAWEKIGETKPDGEEYVDEELEPGTGYYYAVIAYKGNIVSKESNIVEIRIPGKESNANPSVDYTGASSWALTELQKAVGYGLYTDSIMNNYTQKITREEFCGLVVKLYEKLKSAEAPTVSPNPFSDTSNKDILKAFGAGIVKGTGQDSFSPERPITRQDICVMLYRAITGSVPEVDTNISGVPAFADENTIGSWALNEVRFAFKNSIMKGKGANRIMPRDNTSREEAIVLIKRVYEAFMNK
ncbi:MAG TPA: S-layer homology domain-containing protein, partial [Negativicutes bacterium]|nr:S-layer homology domain-containing protein [Negativicutes bacterium]